MEHGINWFSLGYLFIVGAQISVDPLKHILLFSSSNKTAYHRISASFVPGLTEHSRVATSGDITVTSVTLPSSFGASPTIKNTDRQTYVQR